LARRRRIIVVLASVQSAFDWVEARLVALEAAGLSAAVIDGGEIVEARGFGSADVAAARPVEVSTLFQAASISKPVTCLAVLRLVARGLLELDRDVNGYLSSWQVPPVEGWQPRLTLRQLMSHTAGLTVHGFPGYRRGTALPSVPHLLDGEPPANTAPVRVDALPGSLWRYSGGGTMIIQLILTDTTKTAFPDLLQELVLEPAGMSTATFEQPLPDRRHGQAAAGYPHPQPAVPGGWHVYVEQAAGGMWCTPADLCRFALAYQAALAGRRGALIPQVLARETMRPVPPGNYGLGPALYGDSCFGHGGGNEGFLSQLVASIEHGFGCAVMTNDYRAGALLVDVPNGLAAILDWPGWQPFAHGPALDDLTAVYAGRYQTAAGTVYEVAIGPDRLTTFTLTAPDQAPIELRPTSLTEAALAGLQTRVSFAFPDEAAPGSTHASALCLHHADTTLTATHIPNA
jgi:CubicO group peptidase (beta-lactamase class C family)